MELPYVNTVRAQLPRHPCLGNLIKFLCDLGPEVGETRAASLVVDSATRKATVVGRGRRVISDAIDSFLVNPGNQTPDPKHGKLLMIENIDRLTMSKLGCELDIEPLFFASHVHSPWRDMKTATLSVGNLPSTSRGRCFASFNYHRTYIFPHLDDQDHKLLRLSNIRRKVDVLPSMGGKRLGIAQHCCSTLLLTRNRSWLGIVLVDSAPNEAFLSLRHGREVPVSTHFHPLLGGTEDFSHPSRASIPQKGSQTQSTAASMFDELIRHWSLGGAMGNLDPGTQPFPFIIYYPLRLIAAEWVNYTAAMCFAMKQYEVPPSHVSYADLDKIALAHMALESWSRRVLSSKAHVDAVIWLLHYQQEKAIQDDDWRALIHDFEYLRSSVTDHGARVENVASLVYSHIHLVETRRAFNEAKNISRLTILALFFVPLSYVSTIFSMNQEFLPGGRYCWVYFAVAIPVLLCVFGLAKSHTRLYRG